MTTTDVHLNATRDNSKFISVFAYARYSDAYGARHLTLFCGRLSASEMDYSRERAFGTTTTECDDYNCADDDCEQYASAPELRWLLAYIR